MQFLRTLTIILPSALLGLNAMAAAFPTLPNVPKVPEVQETTCNVCVLSKVTVVCKAGDAKCVNECGVPTGTMPSYNFTSRILPGDKSGVGSTIIYEVVKPYEKDVASPLSIGFGYNDANPLPKVSFINNYNVGVKVVVPVKGGDHYVYSLNAKSQCKGPVVKDTKTSAYLPGAVGYKVDAYFTMSTGQGSNE